MNKPRNAAEEASWLITKALGGVLAVVVLVGGGFSTCGYLIGADAPLEDLWREGADPAYEQLGDVGLLPDVKEVGISAHKEVHAP